jgi:hypothetical protein
MALRPEEKFVLTQIVDYLGGDRFAEVMEGEDPPDAYLITNNKKHLLEITQLSPIITKKDGTIESRLTQDIFGLRLLNEIESEFGKRIPINRSLYIHLKLPVPKPTRFKSQLRKTVQQLLDNDNWPQDWKVLRVDGEQVYIKIIQNDLTNPKRVISSVVSSNSSADILATAKAILNDRLEAKNKRCKELSFQGPKWLGLLNQYCLADIYIYQLALNESEIKHEFEKIFFVQDTGEVALLNF